MLRPSTQQSRNTTTRVFPRATPAGDINATDAAAAALKHLFEHDPPYGAQVSFEPEWGAAGWNAPPLAPWLEQTLNRFDRAHDALVTYAKSEKGPQDLSGLVSAVERYASLAKIIFDQYKAIAAPS